MKRINRPARVAATMACAVATATTLAACGSSDDAAGKSDNNGGKSSGGEKIAYSTPSLTDPYRVILAKIVEQDAKANNLSILPTVDANNDPAKQITDFSTLLGQGVKGIVGVVQDSKAIKPALDRAEAKKVPVVVLDQGPDTGHVTMIVTSSSIEMGQKACKAIAESLKDQGTVLELQGALSGAVGRDRSKGFNECMKSEHPNIKVISKPTEWIQEKATDAAQTVLSTNRQVGAIFLASDSAMLPGVQTVLKRLGRLKPVGQPGHVGLVTIDGSPFSLEQVRAGYVDAAISQPLPGYAKYGLQYLRQAIDGKTFKPGPTDHDSEIVQSGENLADVLQTTIVTKDNADDPALWGNQQTEGK